MIKILILKRKKLVEIVWGEGRGSISISSKLAYSPT